MDQDELLSTGGEGGEPLQARLDSRRRKRRVLRVLVGMLLLLLVASTSYLGWRTYSLTETRDDLRMQVHGLQQQVHDGNERADDLTTKLMIARQQLDQLTTDASGKDAVIKGLQDDAKAKQDQIDALTKERSSLKACLDGVTLALVQLTNDGSAAAKSTLDGVRDTCKQVEVLL